ncbi:cupin domain-containing protein [Mycolicibacterium sp. XJ1819]
MTVRILTTGAAMALAAGITAGAAAATPPSGEVERTDLAEGTSTALIAIVAVGVPTTLYVQNIVLGPSASSGWHTHPGPEHSVVNDGTVHLQVAGACAPAAFAPGQAIFIPAGVPHVVYNEGPEHAEAVVTYTLPAERPVRDDAPAACP